MVLPESWGTIVGIPYPSANAYAVCVFNFGEKALDLFDVLETITEAAIRILATPPTWETYGEDSEITQKLIKFFDDVTIGGGPITSEIQYG
jgi:hypothetical protein